MSLATDQYAKLKDLRRDLLIRKFSMQFAYGHREILLNFSKLDLSSLLIGIVQHGVGPASTLYSDWPTPRASNLKRSNLWIYSKSAVRELVAGGAKNVSAIGSPWLYSKLLHNYQGKKSPSKTKYLVFPRHYSFSYISQVTDEDILEKIRYWKSIAGSNELEICLYWSEFLDLTWHRIARAEEVVLVCVGAPQTSPVWAQTDSRINFYTNLRELIDSASHCIFESFTSAIFYAADLGKNVGIFQTNSSLGEVNREIAFQRENDWLLNNIPGIFNSCEINPLLNSIAHELLGYEDLLSAENLANVLRYQSGILPKNL